MSKYRKYKEHDLLRLAKRINNAKRSYLLVNPLQGKHIPVDPDSALAMMQALGKTVKEHCPGRPLVIGFSETATAIGAAVAAETGSQSFYIQTTREPDDSIQRWVYFSEEHSHATEQKLCGDGLDQWISRSDYVLLVDDEISTGKTILNIVSAIRSSCPSAEHKSFVVASIMNSIEKDRLSDFARNNISFVFLLHLHAEDYEDRVRDLPVREATFPRKSDAAEIGVSVEMLSSPLPMPRRGLPAGQYLRECQRCADEIIKQGLAAKSEKLLVLGTEEFMFPSLILAQALKKAGTAGSIKFQATTRSPIGICQEQGYPITNGVKLHSFYDSDRFTYLYDLESYDSVIIFTDAQTIIPEAIDDLKRSLDEKHCGRVLFLYGSDHV